MSMEQNDGAFSRRDFIRATAATAALAATGNYAYAQGSDKIRVGLIGCGGRGNGAALNAVESADGVEIVSLGDLFPHKIDQAVRSLPGECEKLNKKDAWKVTPERSFSGFDAFRKVLATDANYIILATPPGFRPLHFKTAVEAGKNIFFEKPVAVDAPGVRTVITAGELAKSKGLSVVTGTQRRHEGSYLEVIKRIHGGAIGDIVSASVYWNGTPLWSVPRQEGWSDVEWMCRNWYYFTWLCGDHIVEQHVHNLDVANWVIGAHPVKAYGMGGRQVRVEPVYGHIYDHFAVEYEYPGGQRVLSFCRQQDGTTTRISEHVLGTKGSSNPGSWIKGPTPYNYTGRHLNPYVAEHRDNIAAIRAGKPLNEARQVAESTLTAIMGRESAYTGLEISWDQMYNNNTKLGPDEPEFGPMEIPPVAMPGKTKLDR